MTTHAEVEPLSPSSTAVSVHRSEEQKHCHSCARIMHLSAMTCPDCGASQTHHVSPQVHSPHAPSAKVQPLPANHVHCRGCGVGIHETAVTCPRCGAQQFLASDSGGHSSPSASNSLPWLAIASIVLGVICVLALLDDSPWNYSNARALSYFAVAGVFTGVASLNTRASSRGVAIAGVVLSSLGLLGGLDKLFG